MLHKKINAENSLSYSSQNDRWAKNCGTMKNKLKTWSKHNIPWDFNFDMKKKIIPSTSFFSCDLPACRKKTSQKYHLHTKAKVWMRSSLFHFGLICFCVGFFPYIFFSSFYAGFLFVLKAKKAKTTKNTIWRQRPDIKYKASIYIWYYIWRWNSSTVSMKEA